MRDLAEASRCLQQNTTAHGLLENTLPECRQRIFTLPSLFLATCKHAQSQSHFALAWNILTHTSARRMAQTPARTR